jgi:hypothetical protein
MLAGGNSHVPTGSAVRFPLCLPHTMLTAIAVIALSVGIGLNTTVFSILNYLSWTGS